MNSVTRECLEMDKADRALEDQSTTYLIQNFIDVNAEYKCILWINQLYLIASFVLL